MTDLISKILGLLRTFGTESRRKNLTPYFLYAITVVIWFVVFAKYLRGAVAMTQHGSDYYYIIKHLMDNLTRGVFPLWDPLRSWGLLDEIDLRFIGEYNPFLWFYPFFQMLGFLAPTSFLLYCFTYYQIGVLGFYLLANRLFSDKWLSLFAAVMFMFSSFVFAIFNNYCINLIVIPVIWFFYYLVAFGQEPRRHYLWGLAFWSALIATTYMPFYFLTLLQPFIIGMLFLFPKKTKRFFIDAWKFIKTNRIFACLCLGFLILSLLPGLLWFVNSAKGEMVLSWRHEGAGDNHTASMSLRVIQGSSFRQFLSLDALFPEANNYSYLVVFVSIFVYVVLCMAVINKTSKLQILLLLTGGWLFLVTLGDLTPVHTFLYKNIYFYRLFRNLIYFVYFMIPIVILFVVDQLRLLLNKQPRGFWGRLGLVLFVILLHAWGMYVFVKAGNMLITGLMALALSALVFVLYYARLLNRSRSWLGVALWLIILIQPVQFFYSYVQHSKGYRSWSIYKKVIPRFSFLRSARRQEKIFKGNNYAIQDSSGFNPWKYTGLRWSYLLQKNIPSDILEEYTRHKFVAFDHVELFSNQEVDYERLKTAFANNENVAFIVDPSGLERENGKERSLAHPQILGSENKFLKIKKFDLNLIQFQTQFPAKKFLVYNDSFHKNWRAWINGLPVPIYQTNAAFKGIWLPAGDNDVKFVFGTPWQKGMHFLLLGLYVLVLGYLVYLTAKANRHSVLRP